MQLQDWNYCDHDTISVHDHGLNEKGYGVSEQWQKDTTPWMKFKTHHEFDSKACHDLVAASGGNLITNASSYPPETTQMDTLMLLHGGLEENFWEVATAYAADT